MLALGGVIYTLDRGDKLTSRDSSIRFKPATIYVSFTVHFLRVVPVADIHIGFRYRCVDTINVCARTGLRVGRASVQNSQFHTHAWCYKISHLG